MPNVSLRHPYIKSTQDFAAALLLTCIAAIAGAISISHAQGDVQVAFREGLNRVAKSLPTEWNFSTVSAAVNREPKQGEQHVEIVVAYERSDIARIYGAVKLINQMIREGRTAESDFARVPSEYKGMPASHGSGFIDSIGKIMGYAAAETRAQASAAWRYRIVVQDQSRRTVGSLIVSHADIMDLVNGRIAPSELARVARIYNFN